MTTVTSPAEAGPAVPAKVRTVAYFTMLVASSLGGIVSGVTAIVAPGGAVAVTAVVGVILSGLGTLAGGLGVAYRPTASQ